MAFGRKNKHRAVVSETKQILTDKSPWGIQEAYKTLRTNVLFSLTGSGCKVIGMTSSLPSDGKSINSVNLALSFGQLGKRVLLIDCDLRKPTAASKLRIKGTPGLSDVLVGQAKIGDCMHRLSEYGIDVLPSGRIPPDSTWLLQSQRLEVLIEELKKVYEYIIIDLPPVTTVADASIMSKYCNGFIVVVRHNSTDIRAVGSTLDQLQRAKARVIGFIYNDAPTGHGGYYRYSYKYKYKYTQNE